MESQRRLCNKGQLVHHKDYLLLFLQLSSESFGVKFGFSTTAQNRATIAEMRLNNSSIHFLQII